MSNVINSETINNTEVSSVEEVVEVKKTAKEVRDYLLDDSISMEDRLAEALKFVERKIRKEPEEYGPYQAAKDFLSSLVEKSIKADPDCNLDGYMVDKKRSGCYISVNDKIGKGFKLDQSEFQKCANKAREEFLKKVKEMGLVLVKDYGATYTPDTDDGWDGKLDIYYSEKEPNFYAYDEYSTRKNEDHSLSIDGSFGFWKGLPDALIPEEAEDEEVVDEVVEDSEATEEEAE